MQLANKVAVITGGAGGIGCAVARLMAQKGAKVVVSDLDVDAVQAVAEPINGLGLACDVSKETDIKALIAAAESQFGQVDLFFSNAGFGAGEPEHVASASNEVWQRQWEVHVMAHVYACRDLLPKMIERGDGYLISTASAAGQLAQIGDAAYTATKHAAVSFAESLAISHMDDGIKVSVICPQYVNTGILMLSNEERKQPLKDVLSAEDCAQIIMQGIEDEAFLILPHPQVHQYMQQRAADPGRWIEGMRRYRQSLLDETGKLDFSRIFEVVEQ